MAYLITVANPADPLALRRIMNTPKRGIGPATEAALQGFADDNGMTLREAMRHVDELGLGPKLTAAISQLATDLDEVLAMSDPDRPGGAASAADILIELMKRTGYVAQLRTSRDPQDEARAENIDELIAVTKEFQRNNPGGTLLDFLTEVVARSRRPTRSRTPAATSR